MASSSEIDPLQEALDEFCQRLHFKVPVELVHCSQFSNEKEILSVAEEEKTKVWLELLQKLGELARTGQVSIDEQVSIVNQFAPRIQSLIDEIVKRHGGYKEEAETLMKGRVQQFCDYFSSSILEKLLLEEDMDIHTLDEHLERGKSNTLNHFGNWRHGNLAFYDGHEKILKGKLEQLANEVLKSQWKHLGECAQLRTPEGQHDRNDKMENSYTLDVAPTSESNIPAVSVVTETLNVYTGDNGILNETQVGIPEEQGGILEQFSGNFDISVTDQTVKAEYKNFDKTSLLNQLPPAQLTGSEQIHIGDGTFTTGERHTEEMATSHVSYGNGGCIVDIVDTDIERLVAVATENTGSSSYAAAQSEGFSDEENITVVSADSWKSKSACRVNEENGNDSIEIEDKDEQEVRESSTPREESELNSNRDSMNTAKSIGTGRKRRRSHKENDVPISMVAKRRKKLKQVPITTPRQSPTLKVKRTQKVAVAVTNSSTSVRRTKSNPRLKTSPKHTVDGKKRGRPAKFVGTKAKIDKVEGGYQCPEPGCEQIFPGVDIHRRHHNDVHQLNDATDKLACPDPKCKMMFSCKSDLVSHQFLHIQAELFTCGSCHCTFKESIALLQHSESCGGNATGAPKSLGMDS